MGNIINRKTVGKGAMYLYLDAINNLVSGFLFWLILSKITSPDIIGISSSIISFVTIFSIISLVGMPGGIQRYLVKSLAEKKIDDIRGNIKSSLVITSVGIIGSTAFILSLKDIIFYSFQLDFGLSILMVLVMGFVSMASLLNAIIIPTFNTKTIAISSLVGTATKLLITLILVLSGIEVYGILIGFMLAPIVSIIILAIAISRKILRQDITKHDKKPNFESFKSLRDIFMAGTSFWIPGIVNTIGSQLGTILVLLSVGASQAGIYFLSFSIVTAIIMINSVLSTLAYPTISSMVDGRKGAVWRFMKISLVLTIPVSLVVIFYAGEVLNVFGNSYSEGKSYLQILLLSILPTTILSGTSVLSYAYGNNRLVLGVGLFTSLPRIFLYLIFVPLLGGNGAAFVYLFGSIIGATVSIIICKSIGLKIFWKQIALLFIIPALLLFIFVYFNINYILATLLTLTISYSIYLLLGLISKEDIQDILKILPPRLSDLLIIMVRKVSNEKRKRRP